MNVDQGLDDIISSTSISSGGSKSRAKGRNAKRPSASKVSKQSTKPKNNKAKAVAKPVAKSSSSVSHPLYGAKRAVVSNMPLDVSEQDVKEYFATRVGKIRKIEGTYRENGKPTGTYTLTFEKAGNALKLLETYSNQPIDGGKSRLVIQILLDAASAASAVPVKPLSERIGTGKPQKPLKTKTNQPRKAVSTPKDNNKSTKKPAARKSTKSTKSTRSKPKTAAELDAEMTDYFSKADDIAV
ncbi:RNA-binding protein [Starmerella bacillaris]|uniref:RNA-binding protein n=1 Tax=Starmerella bacillaris TaxID=1247836 RepID=A0AAV5RE19_STABA|nr:RNA-binding protein [Starmerella bacillaris]